MFMHVSEQTFVYQKCVYLKNSKVTAMWNLRRICSYEGEYIISRDFQVCVSRKILTVFSNFNNKKIFGINFSETSKKVVKVLDFTIRLNDN